MKSSIFSILTGMLLAMPATPLFAQANLHREYINTSQRIDTRQISQNKSNLYTIISEYEQTGGQYGSLFTQINANSTPINNILHQGASPTFTLRPKGLHAYTNTLGNNQNVICGQSMDMQNDGQNGSFIMETSEDGRQVHWAKYYDDFQIFNAVVSSPKGYIACGKSNNAAGFIVTRANGASFAKYVSTNNSPVAFDQNVTSVYNDVIPLNNHLYALVGTCTATRFINYQQIYHVSFIILTIYDEQQDKVVYNDYISNDIEVSNHVQETGKSLAYDAQSKILYIAGEKRRGNICQYESDPILLQFDVTSQHVLSYHEYNTNMVSMVDDIQLDFTSEVPSIWILGTNNNIEETNYYLGQGRSFLLEVNKLTLNTSSLEVFDNGYDLILRSFVLEPNYNLKLVGNAYNITALDDEDGNFIEMWAPNNRIYEVQTRQYGHTQHCNDYYGTAQPNPLEYAVYPNNYVRNKTPFLDFDVTITPLNRSQEFICEEGPVDDDNTSTTQVKNKQQSITNQVGSIYPNPANQFISITSQSVPSHVRIYDISGSLIITTVIPASSSIDTSTTIDVSGLHEGLYLIEIQTGDSQKHERLLIKH